MLNRLHRIEQPVQFTFDGVIIQAERGDMLATALLAAGIDHVRQSVVSKSPRAPYCLMGVCFECLVTVDGVQNRQACLTEVEDGMTVMSQMGAPTFPKLATSEEGIVP
ncbi:MULTISPECIES: (2Fe-2S)-binding protein [Agrobacterium]|uniref:(2Fe-2S)-binding protein n=1 Tax=Agrobacterium vitis TaxID=373 RepID=A0AAE2R805_AGRVI|nr:MULTISPECIES: (2Fe-2S)-binding protein [Agrobacterium]MBF2712707.1 (2Fe-2S)-binding protein [Agrobacterium vitis]MCM2436070.1 (2Fe-2S)-binding protein [Agrobacterium rosae]MCW8059459.1 (2Fe-2S)-binding protein [Agrobacterium tumefaciens]MCW8145440.1 (2Fe-2S)-binding protein [Agrobacterium tumefaciens]MQB13477.1 (2Fe-2S)-binding protein [Agrobacterium sp. ICMP 6402]